MTKGLTAALTGAYSRLTRASSPTPTLDGRWDARIKKGIRSTAGAFALCVFVLSASAQPLPDKKAACMQYRKMSGLLLEFWKAGHSRGELHMRSNIPPDEAALMNRAADQTYISIAGILAREGHNEDIQRDVFESVMFDACMAEP